MSFTPEQTEAAKTALENFRKHVSDAEIEGREVLNNEAQIGRAAFKSHAKQFWSAERRTQARRLMKLAKTPTNWNSAASVMEALELSGLLNTAKERTFAKMMLLVNGIK